MKKLTFTLRAVKITILFVMFFLSGMVVAQEKITICHCPPGNPDNCHSITIAVEAWYAHFENHIGDYIGSCTDFPDRKLVEVTVYPNPSFEQTTITYVLLEESAVTINVYNTMGLKVMTMLSETQPAGTYTETFIPDIPGTYLLSLIAVTPYEAVQDSETIIDCK